jgi:fatty-acid peroxygenase
MPAPHDPILDLSLAILFDGYEAIWKRCRRLGTDHFTTRVLGRPAICLHGGEAAKLFYDEERVRRRRAIPRRVVTSLFGKGAVHTLDDQPHRARKAAFLAVATALVS